METLYTMFTLYWIASRADTKSFPAYSMNSIGTELEQVVRTYRSEHRARAVGREGIVWDNKFAGPGLAWVACVADALYTICIQMV